MYAPPVVRAVVSAVAGPVLHTGFCNWKWLDELFCKMAKVLNYGSSGIRGRDPSFPSSTWRLSLRAYISRNISLVAIYHLLSTHCPLVASPPNTFPTCSTPPSTTTLLSLGVSRLSNTEKSSNPFSGYGSPIFFEVLKLHAPDRHLVASIRWPVGRAVSDASSRHCVDCTWG